MARKKATISRTETDQMFGGDLLDRVSGTEKKKHPKPPPPSPTSPSKSVKVSLYLKPEDINALDKIIMRRRLESGNSPRRTHLIREAIHQWLETQEPKTEP